MAFASTVSGSGTGVAGYLKKVWGTFTNGAGDTGGTIETGLAYISDVHFTITSHIGTEFPKVTITTSDGTITILTSDGVDGLWTAEGAGEG